ncbi:MAG TPA: hypothetical protein VGY98_01185 [Verrucomicrobiae bacterium]|jgi:hypothetical protein|nr:hypothetical protein [Verrucomicrobiae bacterium]
MEFDWNNAPFEMGGSLTQREIEESFEDPFAIRLLPDSARFGVQARFFNLGISASGIGIFSVYRTNGRQVRVLMARAFEPEEQYFYQRKVNQTLQ